MLGMALVWVRVVGGGSKWNVIYIKNIILGI